MRELKFQQVYATECVTNRKMRGDEEFHTIWEEWEKCELLPKGGAALCTRNVFENGYTWPVEPNLWEHTTRLTFRR